MSKMISVASGFQYSVNIGYDLGNAEKLKNFIPTKSALGLLEAILLSTDPKSTERARILIGAYGKGKSHVVLTILSMLMKKDISLFEKMMPKVSENPRLLQLVENYYDSNNKILPVVITGNSTSLTQAFLLGLQRTLASFDLLKAMPETNYQAAVSTIERWEKDFPAVLKQFEDGIGESAKAFTERLLNYDVAAYESFEKIYPKLTAGSIFNPFLGFDVVDLYESVAKSLKAEGYTGLYVVYDEFSKYLEANITNASVSDTKMLQDFAEKCNRSEELQMHIMLISHKEIANYIDKLPKQKVDGWRGVSERFKHVHMSNNFSQTYEIISSVIQRKKTAWNKFCKVHKEEFQALVEAYRRHQMFIDAGTSMEETIIGCYPLHPVSTFILPRLSEKVAQNERTLFTFLSASGTATLSSFLDDYDDEEFRLLTPDMIYDYFEPLFKKEAYAGEIHNIFVLTSSILNQIQEETLGSKIVKTIALIYMLEQFERLCPTKEQIIAIYSGAYRIEEIEEAIADLIEKDLVVYIKRSNDYLKLKKTSGVDILEKIHDMIESQSGKVSVKEVLNKANFDNYMYPSRYNNEREMTRFFSFQFIDSSEAAADVNWKVKGEGINADGVIYAVIPNSEEELTGIVNDLLVSSKSEKQAIFIVPRHYTPIQDIVREYSAVSKLRESAADDPVLFDEYSVIYDDLYEVIREYIGRFTRPERRMCTYIYDGETVDIRRKSELTELMSGICDSVYSMTPVVNNEAVNKKEITTVALNSRNKIIGALLRRELEPNLGLVGNGQEVSIMRSTLIRTGIWIEGQEKPSLNLSPEDPNMSNMLAEIDRFIVSARKTGAVNFGAIYDILTSPEHHIGLRDGLIPIYLAAVLHKYRQQTVICDRFGPVTMSVDTIMQISADPEKYTLEYLDWNPEKEEYIGKLAEVFKEHVIEAEKAVNAYEYAANAIRHWYMALPKYTKECRTHPQGQPISRQQREFLKLLHQNTGAIDLLFKEIPKLFNAEGTITKDTVEHLAEIKKDVDGLLDALKTTLIKDTMTKFLPAVSDEKIVQISFSSAVRDWCDKLDPKIFEQLFSDGTDRFLKILKESTNDEFELISQLGQLAAGLRLEDWNDDTAAAYDRAVDRYIASAMEFHSNAVAETINETSSYQITFADGDGENMTKRFDKVDVSARGKLLFNQINSSLDAMGHSISEQEKRQILMEILKKLC